MLADGVFAIAMTILVLDLKVPEARIGGRSRTRAIARARRLRFLSYLPAFSSWACSWYRQLQYD
jgi:uncharacterized membrane protein